MTKISWLALEGIFCYEDSGISRITIPKKSFCEAGSSP